MALQVRSIRLLGVFGLVLGAATMACGETTEENTIEVSAQIVEADAPVSVEVTELREGRDEGTLSHEVRVTWEGEAPRRLDDARFTHEVEGENGVLITAGRGCGATWEDERQQVISLCLMNFLIVELSPDESHDYPVEVYPEVGPRRLGRGTYVVEEIIHWSPVDDGGVESGQRSEGAFTVRLTYEVR